MKLEKLHIYGYGKLIDVEFPFSSLSVIYGENEAGKSTIRSFIKSILFGFPTRGQYRYEPKKGGTYGGAITMQTEQYGRIKVERLPKTAIGEVTVYLEDGTIGTEELLQQLLKGIDVSLFEAVFSFDMHGLQNIHGMNRDELGGYLFSAGAIGTDALLQVEKKLDREMEALFKPNGRKPVINGNLQDINKLYEKLKKWQDQIATYEQLIQQKRAAKERLQQIQQEKALLHTMMKDYDTMRTLQPLLVEQKMYEDMLQSFTASSFPVDGVMRYEKLDAKRKPIEQQLQALENKITHAKEELQQLSIATPLLEQEALLEECRLQHLSYETAKQEEQACITSLRQIEEEIEEWQSSIGLGGDEALFSQLDTSLVAKEAITEVMQQSSRLLEQKQQLDERFASVKDVFDEQEEQTRHLEEQLLSGEDRAQYEEQKKLGNTALSAHMLEDLQARKVRFVKAEENKKKQWNVLFLVLLTLDTVMLIASAFIGKTPLLLISLVLFVCFIFFLLVGRKKTSPLIREIEQEIKMLQQRAGQEMNDKGIEAHYRLEKDEELKQLVERERFKLQQAERAYERIVNQYEEWERSMYLLQSKVDTYKAAYHLPNSLTPMQLLPAFERIEKIKMLSKEANKQHKRLQVVQESIRVFEEKVQQLQEVFSFSHSTVSAYLHSMSERAHHEKQKARRQKEIKEQIIEWTEERDELLLMANSLKKEQDELLQMVSALSQEEFLQKGREYEERCELKKQISFLTTQINVHKSRLQEIRIEDQTHWGEDYEQLFQEKERILEQLHEEEHTLQTNVAQYNVEIAHLEEGSTYADLLHEWEMKRSQLREQVKHWAAYAAARAMLTKTKKQYHEVRLPQILEKAEQYFIYVTDGQYIRVFAPTEEQSFLVERKDGQRFNSSELSQATAEQLYLSLRLALAETFATSTKLPLIVDDSFVHFDKERTERTLALLKELSIGRQVIFFTCHPHLLTYFEEANVQKLEGRSTEVV
ncbi:AAA family ATPase [Microbacteriaceae bacterium 4G12]